jgi:hypothetical protein
MSGCQKLTALSAEGSAEGGDDLCWNSVDATYDKGVIPAVTQRRLSQLSVDIIDPAREIAIYLNVEERPQFYR